MRQTNKQANIKKRPEGIPHANVNRVHPLSDCTEHSVDLKNKLEYSTRSSANRITIFSAVHKIIRSQIQTIGLLQEISVLDKVTYKFHKCRRLLHVAIYVQQPTYVCVQCLDDII